MHDTDQRDPATEVGAECTHSHSNPYCKCNTSADDRARMLQIFLDKIEVVSPNPLLMPLREESKEPRIFKRCTLESEEAQSLLVTGDEAVKRLRDGDESGFFIYAGKPSHNTEDLVFADRDDPDRWPFIADTLRVLSGSGEGDHETYVNAGGVQNSEGKDKLDGAGGIRAENWGVVTPGSVHPSGGVYHILNDKEIAVLSTDDLPPELRPNSGSSPTGREKQHQTDVDIDTLPDNFDPNEVRNDSGYPLGIIRNISDDLNRMLSEIELPDYPSASEVDQATVRLLLYWRFHESDIANILRSCRSREKLRRDDYIRRTIKNTTIHAPIDEDLMYPLLDASIENGNRPPVSGTSLAEARDALLALDEATTAELAESAHVDWGDIKKESVEQRLRRSLNLLERADYVSKTTKSMRGAPDFWIATDELEGLHLPPDDNILSF